MANRIYTVGHSTRDFHKIPAMLENYEITHLVDVCSFPSSRKCPQWNQSAIIDALPPDIEYRWIPKLGGRRHNLKGGIKPWLHRCGSSPAIRPHGMQVAGWARRRAVRVRFSSTAITAATRAAPSAI